MKTKNSRIKRKKEVCGRRWRHHHLSVGSGGDVEVGDVDAAKLPVSITEQVVVHLNPGRHVVTEVSTDSFLDHVNGKGLSMSRIDYLCA